MIKPRLVLVACEFSGTVRRAFRALGHNAYSCDLLPSEDNSPFHFQKDVRELLHEGFDLMIAHPPCTYLCRASAPFWKTERWMVNAPEALQFVRQLAEAPIPNIAIENPVGRLNQWFRYPSQTIEPWQFGSPTTKKTCLWLKGLELLQPTWVVEPTSNFVTDMNNHRDRWKTRSRTFPGIAAAMAWQWGGLVTPPQSPLLY